MNETTCVNHYYGSERNYTFDFSVAPEIVAGATISSVVSITASPADELTIGTASISGDYVTAKISGGTAETKYLLWCLVTLSNGTKIVTDASLFVTYFV